MKPLSDLLVCYFGKPEWMQDSLVLTTPVSTPKGVYKFSFRVPDTKMETFDNHNFETRDPKVWVFLKYCWWIYKNPTPPKKNGKIKNPVWWDSCSICMISTGVICISNTRFCHLQWQWKVMKGFPLIRHHLGWKSVSSVLILQSSQVLGSNNLFFPLEVHPKFRMFHLKISPWKRIFLETMIFRVYVNLWGWSSQLLGSYHFCLQSTFIPKNYCSTSQLQHAKKYSVKKTLSTKTVVPP